MAICKQSASSALFFWIVLTQHVLSSCIAIPITANPSNMAFTFEVYHEHQRLTQKAVTSGLYQQLREGAMLPADVSWSPTALWNSTATNKTAACHQYLRDNGLDQPSAESCAASYVCNVTENLHRFPAVLIHAECSGSESRCTDSYHTGFGFIDGSRGSCQAKSHHRVSFLVFTPQPTAVSSAEEVANTQLRGEWIFEYEYLPLNCQCKAK